MSFFSRGLHPPEEGVIVPEGLSCRIPDTLPTMIRKRDLVLLIVLVTIIASDVRGMQFAENAVFFYWFLAFVTFLLPSLWVFSWLIHQAPRHVPLYVWIIRLVPERWRSALLFLIWWPGILIALATLGTCLSLIQSAFPPWLGSLPAQCLAFAALLLLATLLISLPLRLFRLVLWVGGLFYLGAFTLAIVVTLVALFGARNIFTVFTSLPLIRLPTHFSWSLFGLALLCLFGLNGPLLLDGEIHGTRRFLRGSTSFLWWGALGSFLLLLSVTVAWIIQDPSLRVMQTPLLQLLVQLLGKRVAALGWLLLFLGTFACVLAYLFIFSRAFLLAARMGYFSRSLARLNRSGTPLRAILIQSTLLACTAAAVFLVVPALLRGVLPADLVNELSSGDQFSLFTSIAGSLWCGLTALMFLFALWLCWIKRRACRSRIQRVALSALCLAGGLTSLTCAFAPLLPDWPVLFLSRTHWYPLVLLGIICSLALAWLISELPRRSALVRERELRLEHEKALREELQQGYRRERELYQRLSASYDELNRLYREQEQAALTDPVTSLFNHRAFMERLEEIVTRCQTEKGSFLLFFLDLDHFKAINDTWGHLAGDAALREVASRLRAALRAGDVAARYGGEEFALIMTGATSAQAREEGERLCRIIRAAPCLWRQAEEAPIEIGITVSIGVATYGTHGTRSKELLDKADHAMYQAKLAGRNCVRVADAPAPSDFPSSGLPTHFV